MQKDWLWYCIDLYYFIIYIYYILLYYIYILFYYILFYFIFWENLNVYNVSHMYHYFVLWQINYVSIYLKYLYLFKRYTILTLQSPNLFSLLFQKSQTESQRIKCKEIDKLEEAEGLALQIRLITLWVWFFTSFFIKKP